MGNCFCVVNGENKPSSRPITEAPGRKAPSVASTSSSSSSQASCSIISLPAPIFCEFAYSGEGNVCLKSIVSVIKSPQATVLVHPATGRVLVSILQTSFPSDDKRIAVVSTTDGRLVGHVVRKSKTTYELNKYRAVVLLQERKKSLKLVSSLTSVPICQVHSPLGGELHLEGPILRGTDLIILSVFIAILL
jgi:hypothetical protein